MPGPRTTLNVHLPWPQVAPLLGLPLADSTLPARRLTCPWCRHGRLQVSEDVGCGGAWFDCPDCDRAGDLIELAALAIERNATHGLQLSQSDKKSMAVRIYTAITDRAKRMETRKRLQKILGVSEEMLNYWLSRAEKDLKQAAKQQAFDLWLSCHTQEEVPEFAGWPRQTVARWLGGFAQKPEITELGQTIQNGDTEQESEDSPFKLTKAQLADADHATDFEPPVYNIWSQRVRSAGSFPPAPAQGFQSNSSSQTFLGSRANYTGDHPDVKANPKLFDGRRSYCLISRFTQERRLEPWAVVDSMGDCSYPFLVETPTEVLCAYYSQHEDKVCKCFLAGFDKAEFLKGAKAAKGHQRAAGAGGARADEPAFNKQTYTYKTAGETQVQADVYCAADSKVRPVVVWLHGGALIVGSRTSVPKGLLDLCRAEGFVLVSLDYRLAPEVKLPGIVEDVEDAFRWLRTQGPKLFHADPERVVVAGGSAGGYLTLLTGCRVRPRSTALVAYWGYGDVDGDWYTKPSDYYRTQVALVSRDEAYQAVGGKVLTGTEGNPAAQKARGRYYHYLRQHGLWTREVTGFDPEKERRQLDPYCPVRNVTPDYPPTLLVHQDVYHRHCSRRQGHAFLGAEAAAATAVSE